MQAWRVALVLCVLVTPAGSLMFDLPSGKVKCFSEDLPAHTMVVSADWVAGENAMRSSQMRAPGPATCMPLCCLPGRNRCCLGSCCPGWRAVTVLPRAGG